MATIQFNHVDKIYSGNDYVVKDFNLEIEDGEFVVFLGPSGCGKSTTLRMLAGLEDISGGEILIDGVVVNDLSPKERNIAMVFQSYALYPHMTVFDNIAFSLKMSGKSKEEINKQVREVADMLQLTPLLERKPKALSGGQRQRVAMGRSLVRTPEVFLFDEPLSNLDAKLRNVMRGEIKELHRKHKKTTVYVTHDQVEAMTLADKVVILRDGFIEQVGTPKEIYHNPANHFVASFIGSPTMNMLPVVLETENDQWFARINEHTLPLRGEPSLDSSTRNAILGIRPSDISLTPFDASMALDVYVENTELLGATVQINGKVGSNEVVIEMDADESVSAGEVVNFYLDSSKMHLFNSQGSVIL
ncbi:sn-glycerol-3-phosphate ABC transporter ATP-binding protein UgpC [Vibrio sp. SM6]|uniref:sn-glycerol-3-phosphate ABC transporter ATP-binding protein UgpC n=1 Tax=Vibrio agarilyticus TaxID=2726741 RepID=A0A7X8YGB0_9VIBR|nr:sn-glycerol-3-phosphate ABC transporter ATP-binding protein UgpC [Vibrio agarilyticus]NLS12202.1 sn-glycerol-3-phosphate ABC transporter ATP-binding protein UgpC [Vibrio agarilyticus]